MRFARAFLLVMTAVAAQAQNWDTTGNSMLNGEFYFRQIYLIPADSYGDLSQAVAVYGNIKFDGNGNYSITTAENAVFYDSSNGTGPLTATGTYSIAASGYGWITSPYASGDVIFGVVSAQGIFVGSSTENTYGYNDMMIAAPVASPVPTASSFSGSWTCADLDLSGGSPEATLSLLFNMNPNGAGSLGSVSVSGYYGNNGATLLPGQNYNGPTYTFSNGAAVAKFPTVSSDYITSTKYFYFSKDGNFLFGGSPQGFDMIVGVKVSGTPKLSGLYYQAGIDNTVGSYYPLDSYYGAIDVLAGSAPQTYLGHQRINDSGVSSSDYTYTDTISLNGSTATTPLARYVVGDGGAVMIGSGIGPYLGISVSVQAPSPTAPGSAPYIFPTGVVNLANSAPFTASIVPGEDLTLYGSNLAPASPPYAQSSSPFPPSLEQVQVTIGGLPAPVFFASAGEVAVVVPYGITASSTCGCVQIQLSNNGVLSNIVTEFVGQTSPGVFTVPAGGVGLGAVEDALSGALITNTHPAVAGENLAVYLTGLGAVTPTINDGDPGPYPLSYANATFAVDFSGTAAPTPSFAGLVPGQSGLYQMNIVVPTGLTAGTYYLGIAGPDTYMSYPLVVVGTGSSSASSANAEVRTAAETPQSSPRFRKPVAPATSTRRPQPTGGSTHLGPAK